MSIVKVAKAAGVSVGTVSRVLNGASGVKSDTVQQILAAMSAMRYVPRRVKPGPGVQRARRLSTPLTNDNSTNQGTILLETWDLTPSMAWHSVPVFTAAVRGVTRATGAQGLTLRLREHPAQTLIHDSALSQTHDNPLQYTELDGLILLSPPVTEQPHWPDSLPTVWLMADPPANTLVDVSAPDDLDVGRIAQQYLQQRGCKRIAFVSFASILRVAPSERAQGFIRCALMAGQEVRVLSRAHEHRRLPDLYGVPVDLIETPTQMIDHLLTPDGKPAFDGLFIFSDVEAARLYTLLLERGIKPDTDLAVISCDNDPTTLEFLSPRPATIDLHCDQIAWEAVRLLQERIAQPQRAPVRSLVRPSLVAPEKTA